jgi:acyl-CoA dehydrogenase
MKTFLDFAPWFDDAHRALGKRLEESIKVGDQALHHEKKVGRRLAELGLFRLLIPGAAIGEGDVRGLCLARERLAYDSGMADSVFAVQGLASRPIILASHCAHRTEILHSIENGTKIGGFALTEPDAGSDVAAMKSIARKEDDAWILDGEKCFISNVGIADYFVVFANADPTRQRNGISAFVVSADAPGLALERMEMSIDHPIGRLRMNGCKIPGDALLGEIGDGLRLALSTLGTFRTSVGAAAVGMAQRAIDETLSRVTERIQFGKPLSDFQLTQVSLAEMAIELDAARLLVARAAWEKDRGERADVEVAMAKYFATESAQRIIDRAVQLHGGLGVLRGSVVEKLYREIRPLRIYEGTSEIQKLIIGKALVDNFVS